MNPFICGLSAWFIVCKHFVTSPPIENIVVGLPHPAMVGYANEEGSKLRLIELTKKRCLGEYHLEEIKLQTG